MSVVDICVCCATSTRSNEVTSWKAKIKTFIGDAAFVREISGTTSEVEDDRINLVAVTRALGELEKHSEVSLRSCSKFLIQGITGHIHSWIKNEWVCNQGLPIPNQDLWLPLKAVVDRHKIKWILVSD